ncbi:MULTISPECIES: DUF948 domain-containing protein [Bacillaceae]|uniref:General stress protein n=2 Tax=Bacillus infantis TaxID=324767 RepID=U5LDE7_9BACI|nr:MULTISPECIES: DUF948 domain-containing protein [Bacillus]OXT18793.1 DUF948 domain containing protein [Bacillus sp. OG2]AGX05864.1 hypothetical protein N288_19945 [Bacillus infantis NRRL B-14911]MCA1038777.1 DUF948 domain-containing protein [Bacillus infantis]MCK6205144.1 DUF948 domain-containing protein [Bacillus infantis]MCP1160123.1 DUF948 domain-containing protein [Bacillus infantis]
MEIILYLSVALIAVAFLVLVIFLSRTLKSLATTLDSVSTTLDGLEQQLDGVTRETTVLLHKTNALASDIQQKSESLNGVVNAVRDVGDSVRKFNGTIQSISSSVNTQVEQNKDKISQVVQWSNVFLELKDKWKIRKQQSSPLQNHIEDIPPAERAVERAAVRARERERAKY